jgi:hypothetical protein
MTRYEQVQQILEEAVEGTVIGAHGNFWRGKSRDQFIAHRVFGNPIIASGNGAGSNLVKALRGDPPFDGSGFPRMPLGFPLVPDDRIAIIEAWIDDGCPDTVVTDAAP